MLFEARDYLVLHNVAGIYAALSQAEPARQTENEDLALLLLRRAVELWRRGGTGPNEVELIKNDPALKCLHGRQEYPQLVGDPMP